MDVANMLHAEDSFFCCAQKILLLPDDVWYKTLLVVRCLIVVKQQYLNIKIALFA